MGHVSERIAKVVQCIICAAGASTTQYLATSLTRFANNVSASVAIAQAVALAVTTKMGAVKTVIIALIRKLGAAHAKMFGLVPSVEVRRTLPRKHRQGQCATIVAWL